MTDQEVAERTTILRSLVGSGVHGTSVESSDRDEMGLCIEPPEYVIGLQHFEQAVIRSKPEGVRSGPDDTDCVIYSLRKWCRLALGGNPSMMVLLFVPDWAIVTQAPIGRELREMAPYFANRRAGRAFSNYMRDQRQKLTGEKKQMRVTRTELIEKFGYDTKYASQIIRLGFQGIEFLCTGRFTLPMPNQERERVLSIRRGEVKLTEVLEQCRDLEGCIETMTTDGPLPAEPDRKRVEAWMIDAYRASWALDSYHKAFS